MWHANATISTVARGSHNHAHTCVNGQYTHHACGACVCSSCVSCSAYDPRVDGGSHARACAAERSPAAARLGDVACPASRCASCCNPDSAALLWTTTTTASLPVDTGNALYERNQL